MHIFDYEIIIGVKHTSTLPQVQVVPHYHLNFARDKNHIGSRFGLRKKKIKKYQYTILGLSLVLFYMYFMRVQFCKHEIKSFIIINIIISNYIILLIKKVLIISVKLDY